MGYYFIQYISVGTYYFSYKIVFLKKERFFVKETMIVYYIRVSYPNLSRVSSFPWRAHPSFNLTRNRIPPPRPEENSDVMLSVSICFHFSSILPNY